jgi:hypothetical protein
MQDDFDTIVSPPIMNDTTTAKAMHHQRAENPPRLTIGGQNERWGLGLGLGVCVLSFVPNGQLCSGSWITVLTYTEYDPIRFLELTHGVQRNEGCTWHL